MSWFKPPFDHNERAFALAVILAVVLLIACGRSTAQAPPKDIGIPVSSPINPCSNGPVVCVTNDDGELKCSQ